MVDPVADYHSIENRMTDLKNAVQASFNPPKTFQQGLEQYKAAKAAADSEMLNHLTRQAVQQRQPLENHEM